MKQLNEMSYFELLDLEAWCEKMIEDGGSPLYYGTLKRRAAKQIKEITINRCLEQFWAQKGE